MTRPIWYEVVIPADGLEMGQVIEYMNSLPLDRFAIGDEVGEGGYHHYQCRIVFKNGKTEGAVRTLFEHWKAHVEPTSAQGHNFNYIEKDGKFYRSWEGAIAKFAYIDLLPWQGQAVAALKDQNDRQITVILDYEGNHGKSWLGKYIEAKHIGDYMPLCESHRDWVAYAMQYPRKCYVIDVPRAESIKQKRAMWTAIEQIKNGCLYEPRYCPRKMWIEPPKMLLFANEIPPLETLSTDRWKIFTIEKCGKLDTLMPFDVKAYLESIWSDDTSNAVPRRTA